MSSTPRMSYAATASKGAGNSQQQQQKAPTPHAGQAHIQQDRSSNEAGRKDTSNHDARRRSPSPRHVPKTASPEDSVYVLTFLTNTKHHKDLTALRNKYFPPKLNRLEAHLTLFHALPGSKLDEAIIPSLEKTAASTQAFSLLAATPFKLKHGIAIGVPKSSGGDAAREVHAMLKREWQPFLSEQDAGGFAAHYTIMNKVDDNTAVDHAFNEVSENFKPNHGTVEGLTLWRYDRSRWEYQKDFKFQQ